MNACFDDFVPIVFYVAEQMSYFIYATFKETTFLSKSKIIPNLYICIDHERKAIVKSPFGQTRRKRHQ